MKWLKMLGNPFVLGLEGFLAGALALALTHPHLLDSHSTTTPQATAQIESLIG